MDEHLVLFKERIFLFNERNLFERASDRLFEQIVVERFLNEVVSTEQERLASGVDVCEGGHHDHFELRETCACCSQQFDSGHVRHANVRQHEIRRLLLQQSHRLLTILSNSNSVSFALKEMRQKLPHSQFIIHNKQVSHSFKC